MNNRAHVEFGASSRQQRARRGSTFAASRPCPNANRRRVLETRERKIGADDRDGRVVDRG